MAEVGAHQSLRMIMRSLPAVVLLLAATMTSPVAAAEPPSGGSVSEVVIFARGRQGTEDMNLTINGQVIGTWNNLATTTRPYPQTITQELTINSLRTSIKNGGWPEALIVDRIEINGTQYQTEDPTTQSTGSWNPATGCSQGTKQSEWLQCANGWFDYTATHGKPSTPKPTRTPTPTRTPAPAGRFRRW